MSRKKYDTEEKKYKTKEEDKEGRSIYLAVSDWDYLYKEGRGHPTRIIREWIQERRENKEDEENVIVGD